MGLLEPIVFLLGVVMGTGSTITVKVLYGLESVGLTGERQLFEKPLFATFVMFVGMTIALPVYYCMELVKRRQRRQHIKHFNGHYTAVSRSENVDMALDPSHPLHVLSAEHHYEDEHVPWRTFFLLVIPSAFDLLGTALSGIGLLFTTVSVYQLVRCSVIIVTALLKATVLRQRLMKYMWVGVAINTVAMILVSSTSFFEPAEEQDAYRYEADDIQSVARDPRVGILFILLSCIVQGSQYVFEEKVMAVDNAPPLVVVGMEGLWGCLLMLLVVFPWAYILPGADAEGCLENFWDAVVMTSNSTTIQVILAAFVITICLYNIFCIYVTFLLNSIWHAILDNFRPISVWGTDLLLYYVFTHKTFGEKWTRWSWLELAGMIVLFIGTAVYNGSIQIKGCEEEYQEIEESGGEELSVGPVGLLASPSLDITNSPIIRRNINRDWNATENSQTHHQQQQQQQQQHHNKKAERDQLINNTHKMNGTQQHYGTMYGNV